MNRWDWVVTWTLLGLMIFQLQEIIRLLRKRD